MFHFRPKTLAVVALALILGLALTALALAAQDPRDGDTSDAVSACQVTLHTWEGKTLTLTQVGHVVDGMVFRRLATTINGGDVNLNFSDLVSLTRKGDKAGPNSYGPLEFNYQTKDGQKGVCIIPGNTQFQGRSAMGREDVDLAKVRQAVFSCAQ